MTDAQPQNGPSPDAARRATLLAYGCTYSMIIGVSSVMPLLPFLAETFEISISHVGLVISAFTLPGIFFTPLGGILADRYGHKAVLIPSLVLFCLGGAGCAAAPDFPTLIALRFIQGVGAASFGTLNVAILADTFSGQELSKYIGWNMTLLSFFTAAFPFLGGVLGDQHWRLAFLLPLTSLPVLLLTFYTPLRKPDPTARSPQPLRGLLHAVAAPRIRMLLLLTFLTFIMLYGPVITCLPVLGAHKFHQNAGSIGMLLIASSLGAACVAPFTGKLSQRFSLRFLLITAQFFYIASLALIPLVPTFHWLIVPIFFFGLGQGLNIPNLQADLAKSAPKEMRASIMAANGMLLRTGQTLAPMAFTAMIDTQGIEWGFYAGVGLACALLILAGFCLPRVRRAEPAA